MSATILPASPSVSLSRLVAPCCLASLTLTAHRSVGAKTAKTLGTVGIATVSDLAAWGVHQQAANAMDLEQCASDLSVGDLERKALEELRLRTVGAVLDTTNPPPFFAKQCAFSSFA